MTALEPDALLPALRLAAQGGSHLRRHASLIGMGAFIALLHLVGWGGLLLVASGEGLQLGGATFGVGIGLTAYLLGVRHAFDADHIAAIDNTTRKLLQEGRPSASVGFWFSCGHSSVVLALTLLIATGVRSVVTPVLDESSQLHAITGLVGTFISGGFLYVIAALNLVVLAEVWRLFRRRRTRTFDEAALERQLGNRGFVSRLLGRVMRFVTKPWQMYVVGVLFGLGFDTATEMTLLVLTGSGAASGLPWYAILCLPGLFAAGMTLFDTVDGSLMTAAYGWALEKPERKLYYNLVVTGLSVIVAFGIGTIEILGLLGERLDLEGPLWNWAASVDLGQTGFVIVGLFLAAWMAALTLAHYSRLF